MIQLREKVIFAGTNSENFWAAVDKLINARAITIPKCSLNSTGGLRNTVMYNVVIKVRLAWDVK